MAEYFHEYTFDSLYFRFIQTFNGQKLGQISTSPNLAISPIADHNVHLLLHL